MAVHRVGVQGVALGPVPHPVPVRQQARDQAFLVERLPDGDGGRARAEERDQGVTRFRRPGHRQRRALRQPGQGARRERQRGLGGRGRGPQREGRVGGRIRGPGQHHFTVLLDEAVRQRAALGLAPPPAAAAALGLPERLVHRVGDGAAGPGQVAHERVRVQQPEHPGHLVLLLQDEPVGGAAGDLVQRVPRVHDRLVRGPDPGPGTGRHPRGRDGLDGVHVPQPAPGLLEVGLEQESQLAAALGSFHVQRLQLGQPGAGRGPPVLQGPHPQRVGEVGVARDMPGVQQPEDYFEVGPGYPAGFRRGAHRVIEMGAGVPDRIPDTVGHRRDAVPPVVQQEHVEVAARQQLTPPVAAHGDQGDPRFRAQQGGQPAVGFRTPPGAVGGERRQGRPVGL